MKGKLTVITGCMFSGKTTKVITLAQEAIKSGKQIAIFYPEIDTRYTKNYITSHDMIQLPSKALPIDVTTIDPQDAELILLDEPFAGVDPISVIDIKKIIQHLCSKNIGVLITDHNVRETLGISDHAYIVSEGNIIAKGTPQEILSHKQVREVYLGDDFSL